MVEGGNSTRFSFDFTVPNGTKKDDTTTISLPKELDFQRYQEFEVYAPDGQAVAKAVIEPKIKTLTMTYTDYVEKHSDIKGHLEMNVVVDRKVVTTANTVAAEITINNKTKITIVLVSLTIPVLRVIAIRLTFGNTELALTTTK